MTKETSCDGLWCGDDSLCSIYMPIGYIQEDHQWIAVYDRHSRRIARMPSSGVRVLGIGADFFIANEAGRITTYDQNCNRLARMSSSNVTVLWAEGQTFTAREGAWTKKYDKHCRSLKQKTNGAHAPSQQTPPMSRQSATKRTRKRGQSGQFTVSREGA
jgi:hypothetical protein